MKVVQFEREFLCIIYQGGNFSPLQKRKRKIAIMKILIIYLFQNIFEALHFLRIFFFSWLLHGLIPFFFDLCFDLYQLQFQTSKINSSMFS